MQRTVFEKIPMDGFRSQKVETIAVTSLGHRLFAGTSDGALYAYDCQTNLSSTARFNCNVYSTIRNQPKEKKPVSSLVVAETWGIVIGIVDGMITAFDIGTFQVKSQLMDTKGCHLLAINERNFTVVVINKKKLSLYAWQLGQNTGFIIRKEYTLPDTPRAVYYIQNALVIGYKKHYEAIDVNTFAQARILDVDKDQRMICVEIPATGKRPAAVLLAQGVQGLVFDLLKITTTFSATAILGERLEWSAPPFLSNYMHPFIVSVLNDSLEVHDVVSLAALQKIALPVLTPSSTFTSSTSTVYSFTNCSVNTAGGVEYGYVCNGDQIHVLRMMALPAQILTLVEAGRFEEAISLCALCQSSPQLKEIDIPGIHEKYAYTLFSKGDFDGAIANFIKSDCSPVLVIGLFPDLVPPALHAYVGINHTASASVSAPQLKRGSSSGKLVGISLTRAAAALAQYCESGKAALRSKADLADKIRISGIGALSSAEHEEMIGDPDEIIRLAELVDTVLLSSLIHCSTARKVAEFLSQPNRCHLESSAVILASQGNAFTEALLWLYRSHNDHKRVLVALSEERCVGGGGWTREQFYQWTTDYLRFLWYSDDPSLPLLALNALRPVLEYDAELGLSVLTTRPKGKTGSFGGKGVTVQEVLIFLESTNPKSTILNRSTATPKRSIVTTSSTTANTGSLKIPLVNGRAVGVTYLEWLVNSGAAPASMHDEYAQLLMEGVPVISGIDHSANDFEIRDYDGEEIVLYKIYRLKLQHFLENSNEYHPDKLLKVLPSQFSHEYALILSKLGRHEEVLKIYIQEMHDLPLAEAYCERIYRKSGEEKTPSDKDSRSAYKPQDENVHLCLIRVLLASPLLNPGSPRPHGLTGSTATLNIAEIVSLAEKYYDRIDAATLISMLPKQIPLAVLAKYLNTVVEYGNTKKRNLQVIHQLLRVREVNIRTSQYSGSDDVLER